MALFAISAFTHVVAIRYIRLAIDLRAQDAIDQANETPGFTPFEFTGEMEPADNEDWT